MEIVRLSDNSTERLDFKWDNTRFSLSHYDKASDKYKVILLNPKEATTIMLFILGLLHSEANQKEGCLNERIRA